MAYDVIVIGAGFAGLTAANRAAEHGLKPIVVERGEAADYMCNSRVCTGVYHIGFMAETAGEDVLYDRIMTITGGTARPDLARTFATHAAPVKAWLADQGVMFQPYHNQPSDLSMIAPGRRLTAGLDWRDNGPDRTMRRLTEELQRRGGEIRRGVAARALVMADGACVGVRIAGPDGAEDELRAGAVVLADGGFQANRELLTRHVSGAAAKLQQRNTGTGVGDGLRMAEEAGAALVGLDKFYGHLLSRDAVEKDTLWPYPQVDFIAAQSILIGPDGRRFTDEGRGGIYMVNAIAQLDDPLSAHVVFDAPAWKAAKTEDIVPPNPALEEAGGTVHRADDLLQLAALTGVPSDALNTTVAEYNMAILSGELGHLTPARTTALYAARPLQTPPFRAIPISAGITVTMGGIAVDGAARVLRPGGQPIPGLYAAGSTAGGMEGGPDAGYLGGVAKAFILGYRAAETIAEQMRA